MSVASQRLSLSHSRNIKALWSHWVPLEMWRKTTTELIMRSASASSHQVKRARQPLYPDSSSLQLPKVAQGNSAYSVHMCWSQESRKAIAVWSTWTLLQYYQTQVAKRHTCTFLPVSHRERSPSFLTPPHHHQVAGHPHFPWHIQSFGWEMCHRQSLSIATSTPPSPPPPTPPDQKAMNFPRMISLARISIIFFIFLGHAQL